MAEILPPVVHIGPSESEKNAKKIFLGCGGCAIVSILGIAAFVLGIIMIFSHIMKSTEVYQTAYHSAQASSEVQQALGTPIKDGFFPTSSINTSSEGGNANYNINISGPHGKGIIRVSAKKVPDGPWTYPTLECTLSKNGKTINLKPETKP